MKASILRKIDNFFKEKSYGIFLALLIFWIGFLPWFELTGMETSIEFFISNLIVISSFYFLYSDRRRILIFTFIALVLILGWVDFFTPSYVLLDQLSKSTMGILFLVITIHFMRKILRSRQVDINIIIIAIAGYIMLAIMASILCWLVNSIYPGAYNFSPDEEGPVFDYTYYSIVTMSTLGYGDITPQIPQSKSLAMFITLTGQFYITVLMAFLVGKFLSQSSLKNN